jgi:hypothetical protein
MRSSPSASTWMMLGCLTVLVAASAPAQLEPGFGSSTTGASPAAYYYISKPGEITMTINLWGFVKNPGRYEVPISTTLVDLVSFAGGPLANADMGSVRIARKVRLGTGTRTVEFVIDLDRLDKLDPKAIGLEPEDRIYVEPVAFSGQDVFNIITTVAIIISATASMIIAVNQSN